MRHLFIINKHAGKNDRYKTVLEQISGLNVDVAYTERQGHATELAREYVKQSDEFTVVFACGGDGTVNEVIRGVYDLDNCSVAPVPIGSGNDFIRSFDKADEDFLNIKKLMDGEDVAVDLLKCNDRISDNSISVGFDCMVANNVDKFKKRKLISSSFAYKLSIFYCLFMGRRHSFSIIADGKKLEQKSTYLLSICAKGKYYGGGIKCAPLADNTDGKIDFLSVPTVGVLRFISLLPTFIKGGHINNPKLDFIYHDKFSEVEYISNAPFDIGFDGEIFSVTSAKISVLPKAVKIRIPK